MRLGVLLYELDQRPPLDFAEVTQHALKGELAWFSFKIELQRHAYKQNDPEGPNIAALREFALAQSFRRHE